MKKAILCIFICVLLLNKIFAQTKAVTETGEQVILFENGTWKFTSYFNNADSAIKTNNTNYIKPSNASFLLISSKTHFGFWLNPKKWTFGKAKNNENAEYETHLKGGELQGEIITEDLSLPLSSLRKIALQNAKDNSPDYYINKEEYRNVNGLKVLYLQSEGTITGIKFNFYSYYFSDSSCTLQFVIVGLKKSMAKDQKSAEELLNGLVVINNDEPNRGKTASKNNDSLSQGSLSVNHNCKKYFEGSWEYNVNDKKVYVERTFNKTIEHIDKYTFEYENKWKNDCEYEIIFKKTNKPKYTLEKVGEVMSINILQIDNTMMRYTALYKGNEIDGEMIKNATAGKLHISSTNSYQL